MKTNPATLKITVLLAMLAGIVSFSQPAYGQPTSPPRIDPVNGMPASDNSSPPSLDPATGMPVDKPDNLHDESGMIYAVGMVSAVELPKMIVNGRYEEALKLCLSIHDQCKSGNALGALMPQWIELGRRFPKAREALIGIRDHDFREFSEGRGYADLFAEVTFINGPLHQDDSTYALFKTIREKDPELAQQCFPYVEGLLVARGDYQWCYDHMGDPQTVFDGIHIQLDQHLADQRREAELHQEVAQRMETLNLQQGRTNLWSQPDYASNALKQFAHDSFVGGTRQLIEILVATDHNTDAEKIRDEAVAIIDDAKLHSAISDAEAKIHQAGANAGGISK
jgi:hypothetical protein